MRNNEVHICAAEPEFICLRTSSRTLLRPQPLTESQFGILMNGILEGMFGLKNRNSSTDPALNVHVSDHMERKIRTPKVWHEARTHRRTMWRRSYFKPKEPAEGLARSADSSTTTQKPAEGLA